MLSDAAMRCGETSDRSDGGLKQFQCKRFGNIPIQEYQLVWTQGMRSSLQMICTVRINIPRAKCWRHATQRFMCSKTVLYNNGVSSWRRNVVWWLRLGCQHDYFPAFWMQLSDDFVKFCSTRWCFGLTLPAPQRGLPSDMQAQSQSQSRSCFVQCCNHSIYIMASATRRSRSGDPSTSTSTSTLHATLGSLFQAQGKKEQT